MFVLSACTSEASRPDSSAPSAATTDRGPLPLGTGSLALEVPTAGPDNCPVHPDVCALAESVDAPLRLMAEGWEQDGSLDGYSIVAGLAGVLNLLRPQDIGCTRPGTLAYQLCAGVPADQNRLGIWLWAKSDNQPGYNSLWEFVTRLFLWSIGADEEGDDLGGPGLRLVGIGCPTELATLRGCREDFSFVISSRSNLKHNPGPERQIMILPVTWPDGNAPAVRLAIPQPTTFVATSDYVHLILGGVVTGDAAIYTQEPEWLSGKPAPPTGVFVPWRP